MDGQLSSQPLLCSTKEMLKDACYYIPYYQRPFSWDPSPHISRFFEDISDGILSLYEQEGDTRDSLSETFLGTVVCFADRVPYSSIEPKIPNDLPNQDKLVLIDGQQRLSVCLTTCIALHDLLVRNKLPKIDFLDASVEQQKFETLKLETEDTLYDMIQCRASSGTKKFYPRIIRQIDDLWSREKSKCKYTSHIGKLTSDYIDNVIAGKKNEFKRDNPVVNKLKALTIRNFLVNLATGKSGLRIRNDMIKPITDITSVFENNNVQEQLFSQDTPIKLLRILDEYSKTREGKAAKISLKVEKYKRIARILTFASYLLQRVKFIKMVTTSENYGFSIFDSLNTTGDDLTAFETFVPEVIRENMPMSNYRQSPFYDMMNEINDYLNDKDNSKVQTEKTKNLIISFALAETGYKLSSDLGRQRAYLLSNYIEQQEGDEEAKKQNIELIQHFQHVSRVFEYFANTKRNAMYKYMRAISGYGVIDDIQHSYAEEHKDAISEAQFNLCLLVDANHKITIPLLSRYYSQHIHNQDDPFTHRAMCQSIISTSAFFSLWRMSSLDTDSIDDHHRNIMYNNAGPEEDGTLPNPQLNYARNVENCNVPDINDLQKEYVRLLVEVRGLKESSKEKDITTIPSKSEWIKASFQQPIYARQRQVAKYLLLVRHIHSQSSERGTPEFGSNIWNNCVYETIDHIVPISEATGPGERELLNSIGNLTLLPRQVNSYINNACWEKRKFIYLALSAEDEDEFEERKKTIVDQKLATAEKIEIIQQDWVSIHNGHYLPIVKELLEYDFSNEKREKAIYRRGKKILCDVWDPVKNWLDRKS